MHNALRYGKTGITWTVVVSVIAWTMGLAALLTPLTVAQALTSGDLIKASQAAVYYFGADGKRYVFPNEKTYKTWYSDFSGVITITDSELAAVPIGGNVTYRPGVKMVKITTDPKVYAVSKNGTLRWVTTEQVATDLYGANWNKMIEDVPDPFFVNYCTKDSNPPCVSDASDINQASEYDKDAEMTDATDINTDKNLAEGGPVGGGSISVSLAGDTPPSQLAVKNAARLPFTKIILTNNTSLDAVVDQVIIERMGLAQDGSFATVDLLDENMDPINNFGKNFNSLHQATVNEDFTVKANSSKAVYLAGNMAADNDTRSGEQAILGIASIKVKGGGTVSGTLPVGGNPFTINSTIVIGSATVVVGANNNGATTQNVGTQDFVVTSFKVTAGSAEKVTLKSVTFTNNGTSAPEDVKNLELVNVNTGTVLDTKASVSGDKVKMALVHELDKGKNVTLDLRLDIDGGSGRTIGYDIDRQPDLVVTGNQFGYNILPSYTSPGAASASTATPYFDVPLTTVGDGELRIESVTLPSTNVAEGLDQVTLGMFKAVAKGEAINVTSIGWNFDVTTTTGSTGTAMSDITNVTVYDDNGTVVAGLDPVVSQASATTDGTALSQGTATSTDTLTIPVGETTYTVKGDLSTDFAANDTIRAGVIPGDATARGDVTGNLITATPASNVQSSTLTVKEASLSVSIGATPSAQTVVAGTNNLHVANIILDASASGDDIRVTSIKLAIHTATDAFPNQITGFKLWDGAPGGTQIVVNSESLACGTAASATCNTAGNVATSTQSITAGNLTVTKNTTKTIGVTANVGTGATSGSFSIGVSNDSSAPGVVGIDSDAQDAGATFTASNGNTMTLAASGTLNVSVTPSDPVSANVIGGASSVVVGKVTLEAENDAIKFPLGFGFTFQAPDGGLAGNQDEVANISLWDGATQVGSTQTPVGSNATITPADSFQVAVGSPKTLTWKASFNAVQTGSPAQAGAGVKVALTNIDAKSVNGSAVTPTGLTGSSFSDFHVFKSLPTVALVTNNAELVNGTLDIFRFNVTGDNSGGVNGVGLFKFTFGVNTSGVTLSPTGYRLYEGTVDNPKEQTLAKGSDIVLTASATDFALVETFFDVGDDNASTPGQEMKVVGKNVTRYFTLEGVASGVSASDSINVALAGDAAYAATAVRAAKTVAQYTGVDGTDTLDDFIWSDLNLTNPTSSTATHATMFFNGFRVPGLDNTTTTAQTRSKS